ncbi:MAG: hypothetical protein RH942_18635 [Kiloniellaceae bacterium]
MTASDGQGGDKHAGSQKDGAGAQGTAAEAPALAIIDAFGGIRPMAKQLGLAVSTVQGWKERGAIPVNRHDQIRDAARKNAIELDTAVLRASAPAEAAAAQPPVIEGKAAATAGGATAGAATAGAATAGAATAGAAGPKTAKDTDKQMPPGSAASAATMVRKTSANSDTPEASPPTPSGSRGILPGVVLGVVLAAVVAGGTVYTQPYWAPLFASGGAGENAAVVTALNDMESRLADLQASLPPDNSAALSSLNARLATAEAALSQGGAQDPETRAALESLNSQLARLSDRLAALEQDVAAVRGIAGAPSAELTSRLSSEAKRLDEMLAAQSELAARLVEAETNLDATQAARDAAPGSRETLMLLATLQLRDALRGSGPYDQPLTMLRNLAAEDADIGALIVPLERRATVGLPSLRELQASFPDSARRIAAIEIGEEGEGWSAGVLRRISEAVNLRPVGLVEGAAPTAVAARAEVKLNDGDLAGALAELDSLDGAAAEAVANWRAEAEARLAADRAVSALGAQMSQRFIAMTGG